MRANTARSKTALEHLKAVYTVVLSLSLSLLAQPIEPEEPKITLERKWSPATLIADGVAMSMLPFIALSGVADSGGLTLATVVAYLGSVALGGPIAHATQGRWVRAFGSFLMRVMGVPLLGILGAITGLATSSGPSDFIDPGVVIGLLVGVLGGHAIVGIIDSTVLSFETKEPVPAAPVAPAVGLYKTRGEDLVPTFGVLTRF